MYFHLPLPLNSVERLKVAMLTAEIRATFSAHCSLFTVSDITGVMQQPQSTE
jgi:hypothetical protein